jgi:hypothetical protein
LVFELPAFCALHKAQARCALNEQPQLISAAAARTNLL